jgi:hypothetical protein
MPVGVPPHDVSDIIPSIDSLPTRPYNDLTDRIWLTAAQWPRFPRTISLDGSMGSGPVYGMRLP